MKAFDLSKLKTFLLLILLSQFLISMNSCSLGVKSAITKSYPPLRSVDSVRVIPLKSSAPSSAEILGTVRIYDAGSINCGYDVVVEAAKNEARKVGGNALKITEHIPPSIWSSCHQITAIILRLNRDSTYVDTTIQNHTRDQLNSSQLNSVEDNKKYKSFYITAEGGWSWRINKIDESLNSFEKDYLSDLKSGYHYGFSGTYYLNRGFGIGCLYDNYRSKNSVMASAIDSSGQTVTGELRDDISINMILLTLDFRSISKSGKNSCHFIFGLGYSGYKDVGGFIKYGKIESGTFALDYEIRYDIFLSDHWYLSPAFALRLATLNSYDVTVDNITKHVTLEKENYEGLSRIDLSCGLRYRF